MNIDIASYEDFIASLHLCPETKSRCSGLFLDELYQKSCVLQEVHPGKVIEEINILDGLSNSRSGCSNYPASEFRNKNSPLKGLWHKHYLEKGLVSRVNNVVLQLKREYGSFEKAIEQIFKKEFHSHKHSPNAFEDVCSGVANKIAIEPWDKRKENKNLTGEWIVFAKYENKNYYLCLGKHGEGDENIRNKVDLCQSQFDFLRQILV